MALLPLLIALVPIQVWLIVLEFALSKQQSNVNVDSSSLLLIPFDLRDCNISPRAHFFMLQVQKSCHPSLLARI